MELAENAVQLYVPLRAFTYSEIYVIRLDGTGLTRVTHHAERDDYPEWHSDGKRLVTVSERNGQHDLYLMNVP